MKIKTSLIALIIGSAMLLQACGPTNLKSLATDLDKAAKILNTAAVTNHTLAVQGIITKADRQKFAGIIHGANDDLAAEIVWVQNNVTDANFATSKSQVKTVLAGIAAALIATSTGNKDLDALLQSAALLINSAVALVSRMQKQDILPYMKEIRAFRLEAA